MVTLAVLCLNFYCVKFFKKGEEEGEEEESSREGVPQTRILLLWVLFLA